MPFQLGEKKLEPGGDTYFIADIAANHDGELSRAKDLIWLAKEAGADCAKFQHFEAASIVSAIGFQKLPHIETHQSNWDKSVYEVYDQYHTRREWDKALIEECEKAKIHFMTTPYNIPAVTEFSDFMHAFKIGSGDITYKKLLLEVAKQRKPVFLATGASDISDVSNAMDIFDQSQTCLMQCNTNYTGNLENFQYVNLNVLRSFALKYPLALLGFSDHTPGHSAVLGAIALGAVAIEKHFTDDNERNGPDHSFALNPITWRQMVDASRELQMAMGDGVKRIEANEEKAAIVQRRSIRLKEDLREGEILTAEKLECLRPCSHGDVDPMHMEDVLGKSLKYELKKGDSITWKSINI